MKFKTPSPAMIVALIALVMATSGTAVAAVSFASNAGAVDGKSAVSAGVSNAAAAGKLVATNRLGAGKGKISSRYLSLPSSITGRGTARSYYGSIDAFDNGQSAAVDIASAFGIGVLRASCIDQNKAAGKEDAGTVLTFTNSTGQSVNYARRHGAAFDARAVPPGAAQSFTIGGATPVTVSLQGAGGSFELAGGVRHQGTNAAAARCVFWGQWMQVAP